jgi:phosphatidylglycerophosphatase A
MRALLNKINLSALISTFFGVGKIPFMPGTIGSVVGYLLFFILVFFTPRLFSNFSATMMLKALFVLLVMLFVIGVYAADNYIKNTVSQDPKEVIIDEIVGQMFVLYFTTFINAHIMHLSNSWPNKAIMLLGPFITFRFFDIVKPWPVCWFDQNIKAGIGIMLDDIIAGVLAVIAYSLVVLMFVIKV